MEVFNFGKSVKNPLFILKNKENNLNYSRFAVVVSKKISKKAVERNHIRRRFLAGLKEIESKLKPADYIFILNLEAKDIQYKDLINNLKNIKL